MCPSCPYLAAACQQVLVDNGCPQASFSVICTPSPATLKLGPRDGVDVPNVCNCLVADMLDDGVLSAGLVPAVAHALEELLVREGPVTVPRRLTVMAHAVGLRPSVVDVEGFGLGGQGGSSGVGGAAASGRRDGRWRFDLTALDRYRFVCAARGCIAICVGTGCLVCDRRQWSSMLPSIGLLR